MATVAAAAIAMLAAVPAAQGTVPAKDGVIVYASAGGDLFSMNPDGTNKHRLMRTAAIESDPAFAPCGCKLAYVSFVKGGSDNIWVMNLDGTDRFKLIGWSSIDDEPSWSPDGTKIAFSSTHDGNAEIYVVKATKTHPAPVKLTHTTGTTANVTPDWSPDGTRIAWSVNDQIYVMSATDGSGKSRVGPGCDAAWPSWSPDGTRIAYEDGNGCGANDYDQIMVAPVNGSSEPVPITPNDQNYATPEWAPSGTRIVYSSDSGIQSRKVDGTGMLKLTATYGDYHPTWQPLTQ